MASPQPRSQFCPPSFSMSAPASSQLRLSESEWPFPALRPSRSSSRSSSSWPFVAERSSSPNLSVSAPPSPTKADSEWPFSALRQRRSSLTSSRSSSSWPFVGERSPSDTEDELPFWHPVWRYKPVAAKDWVGIYPPVLPPPDFFDLEEEEKWINEEMFKKDNITRNYLYDETGKVNLPVDEKGILILDPVSRTRIIDAMVEPYILAEYSDWIDSAIDEAHAPGAKQTDSWLRELNAEVQKDHLTVVEERDIVIDEERKKRGLTDRKTHMDWWDISGRKLAENRGKDDGQCDSTTEGPDTRSESPHSSEAQSVDKNNYEDLNVPDDFESAPQDHEDFPESPRQASPPPELSPNPEPSPSPPPLDLVALWW